MQSPFAFFPKKHLLFIGSKSSFTSRGQGIEEYDLYLKKYEGDYLFSALGYDLKNQFNNLSSNHQDVFDFPEILAFVPEQVIQLIDGKPIVLSGDRQITENSFTLIKKILSQGTFPYPSISLKSSINKSTYIQQVQQVQAEIQYGNCYELNFCQQYVAEQVDSFDSFEVFLNLYNKTKSPFSVYFYFESWEVMCLSPERYIQKTGRKLISQPIKGTVRRGKDIEEDLVLQNNLKNDSKEKSENVMIVDLVRNDLSKIASKGSVTVDELFGVYQFETLHHMISTISCELKPDISFTDCLSATFPMGSMTGAPKKKVMELIEKYETFKRGLYSGSIGYILPSGDYDFNVVIRSLFYNNYLKTLSCAVGSAITIKAEAEKEYEECEVKVGNLLRQFK
jgi:para-aminobenzoate synthetase component 1